MVGEEFEGINVVANTHTMMRYIKNEVVDEVFIDLDYKLREQIRPMVMELEDMGIMVHLRVEVLDSFKVSIHRLDILERYLLLHLLTESLITRNCLLRDA